ncbi:unnamed protein product [Rotaria sp. Silwood2]|nr:unnamed protein product [Rotaria sp. Silwood2]
MKTAKLKYGNRGHSQSCLLEETQCCFITSHNHGFTVQTSQGLGKDWCILFTNQNDQSNEGIIHDFKPFFSVQFHPEHSVGPSDTENVFQIFLDVVQSYKSTSGVIILLHPVSGFAFNVASVNLGFYFKEIQAIKAMKEENIYTILNNPNFDIARTSKGLSDTFYSLSITPTDIEQVIQITGPEVILLNFGEQTALNCGIQLHELGILQKYSSVLFSATFPETDRISGFVEDREELISLVTSLLTNSSQLLIDKSLKD